MTRHTGSATANEHEGGGGARPGTRTRARRTAALGLGLAVALAVAAPAAAEPPFAMSEPVMDATTDQVLGNDIDEVVGAGELVADRTDLELWTVYVDSFDGMDRYDWANETAIASDAALNVLVLAVAVDDGDFGFSVDEEADLTNGEVAAIESAIDGEVDDGDWSGAAVAAADAIVQLTTGVEPTSDDDGGESTGTDGGVPAWVIGGGIGLLGAIGVGVLASRRRRGRDAERPQGGVAAEPAPDPWAGTSTEDLGRRAGSALVQLDNDVRSCANELAFAEAQFGLEATKEFKVALASAQQQLGQAFAIQQQLNDSTPENEEQHRAGLIEIMRLCEAADATLDTQTEAMSRLRALQDRAPEVLDELEQRNGELAARVPAARDTLKQLGATYPATALATVARAPEQAEALLASAQASVAEGRSRVQADDRGTAVAYARTAEDALQQVATLLDMVGNAGRTLAEAGQQLDGAIASITTDVSDAGRLAPGDATIAPAVQRAQSAIETADAARSGGDPIAALTELAAAEQALDAALAPRREAEQVQTRVTGQVATQIAKAESAIRQANDYIETNRGAVDTVARTRLATASESLTRARSLQAGSPQEALAAANAALDSATSALQLAQNDVGRWRQSRSANDGYYGGSGGIDPGSLILGGILGRSSGGGYRGSYGSGSSWGGGSSGGWGGSASRSSGRSGRSSGGGRRMKSVSRSSGGARRSSGSTRRSSGGRRR